MFKKPVGFDVVPHRMGGSHAKRDPLLDEKVGSAKRHKASDLSNMAYYKETPEERKARLKAEKRAEKAMLRGEDVSKIGNSEEQVSDLPADNRKGKKDRAAAKLEAFKEKLKSCTLPADAAQAEKKHKDVIRKEEAEALEKSRAAAAAKAPPQLGPAKPRPPDEDERLTFAEIWKEGDEEGESDWLGGAGLKFHTTADKAFSMDSKRFKESATASASSIANAEKEAEAIRKRGEMRMAEFRRQNRGPD